MENKAKIEIPDTVENQDLHFPIAGVLTEMQHENALAAPLAPDQKIKLDVVPFPTRNNHFTLRESLIV